MNKKILISVLIVIAVGVGGYFAKDSLFSKGPKSEPKTEEFVTIFADKVANAVIFKDWDEQYSYLSPEDKNRISFVKFKEIQNESSADFVANGFSISSIIIEEDIAKVRYLINIVDGFGNEANIPQQLELKYIDGKWYEPMPQNVETWLSKNK